MHDTVYILIFKKWIEKKKIVVPPCAIVLEALARDFERTTLRYRGKLVQVSTQFFADDQG